MNIPPGREGYLPFLLPVLYFSNVGQRSTRNNIGLDVIIMSNCSAALRYSFTFPSPFFIDSTGNRDALHFIPIIGDLFETRERNPDYTTIVRFEKEKFNYFEIKFRGEISLLPSRYSFIFPPSILLLAFVLRGPASNPRALNSANLLP